MLTVKEAATQLHCSGSMVYELFRRGKIRGYRVGGAIRIFPEACQDYIKANSNLPAPQPKVKEPKLPRTRKPPKKYTTGRYEDVVPFG
jgi:excisionase family DNA binding protein